MTEWYEKGYPGGPMVAVRGFPRALYPPDSAPAYKPSVDGSDVEAYKRTVSRAGRWVWQQFDQAFSNSFSHGKGPNVKDTGVAGVQRQQGIKATGFIGNETFNLLRSIKIPDGLPHAGEYAMDAHSVELINDAFDRFKGKEPSDTSTSSAQARLAKAKTQLGIKESPPHSNRCKYTDWYGMVGPWCAMFVTWCDVNGGKPVKSFQRGVKYAYCPYIVSDARLGKNGLSITSSPKPGDLVVYDWSWDGIFDHVGIVKTPPDGRGTFEAIEGNTSMRNQSNGGEVMDRTRNKADGHIVFVRVNE
jgi:hypothetical protein